MFIVQLLSFLVKSYMRWYHTVPPVFVMVLYGTSVVKEKERVMARASMSKRWQEGGDEAAVRERILEAAFAAFMESGYATTSTI